MFLSSCLIISASTYLFSCLQSWITVIGGDISRQGMLPPQPALSEAYLSGSAFTQVAVSVF